MAPKTAERPKWTIMPPITGSSSKPGRMASLPATRVLAHLELKTLRVRVFLALLECGRRLRVERPRVLDRPLAVHDVVGKVEGQEAHRFLVATRGQRALRAFHDDAAVIT